jgi:acyl-CoA reductase-like NAD-dependent aldehyde dehydrogenase
VTFTGSVATGQHVMRSAATSISSLTLELGGKSPAIVMSDANIDTLVHDMIEAIYYNSGQVCSAGSRLVIHQSRHAEFIDKFLPLVKKLTIGHGLNDYNMGAITSRSHLAKITGLLDAAKQRGAQILCGGRPTIDASTGKGFFFEPTVVDKLDIQDPLIQQEVFGPVLSIQVMSDDEEAVSLANGTNYGLAACVYTKNISKALEIATEIDAGQVTVNKYYAGGIYTPFGGTKMSGFGREKGLNGISSYLRTKNITVML